MGRRRTLRRKLWRAVANTTIGKIVGNTAQKFIGFLGGGYNAVDPRRKIIERRILQNRQTANELLNGALPPLRAHCRHLLRNNPMAKAVRDAHQALIVGTGISLEPTGDESGRIKDAWDAWARHAGVNGESLAELQRQGISELDASGEVLWRLVILPDLADRGEIPLRILPLDSEWLVDEAVLAEDNFTVVNGVAVDRWGRPVRYALKNPHDETSDTIEWVPATEICHIFERQRPVQNRGEPWLASMIETLQNGQDLVDTELAAAKVTASPAMVVTSEMHEDPDTTEHGDSDDPVQTLQPGGVTRLFPGDKFEAFSHMRPTPEVARFHEFLRGQLAASGRIPSRFLDRDVSRANYSSMKADQIDSNMILGPVRNWYGEATAGKVFQAVLPFLSIQTGAGTAGVSYRLIPDEVPFLDPVKDGMGILLQIAGGLTTWQQQIGKRGGNAKEIADQLRQELADPLYAQIFGANLPAALGAAGVQQLAAGQTPEAAEESPNVDA